MSKFAPIHIYSGYSLLKSGLTTKKIETAIQNNDYFGMGLTDENSLSGFPPFAHSCLKNNKLYILGLSICIDDNHFAIYAKNDEGYLNLISISNAYQKEELNFAFLKSHSSGLIGVL